MAREVFTRKDVGDFYNTNFINLKIDMEKEENLVFRQKYPVSAFPTLFYIKSDGEVIRKVKGAQKAESFIQLGKSILSKIDYSACLLYSSPSPRDQRGSRMPSSA